MKEPVAIVALSEVKRTVPALLPALAGLGLTQDTDGLQMLMDEWLERMESLGAPREFCYRVLVGALSTSLGHHAGREAIDDRLIHTLEG